MTTVWSIQTFLGLFTMWTIVLVSLDNSGVVDSELTVGCELITSLNGGCLCYRLKGSLGYTCEGAMMGALPFIPHSMARSITWINMRNNLLSHINLTGYYNLRYLDVTQNPLLSCGIIVQLRRNVPQLITDCLTTTTTRHISVRPPHRILPPHHIVTTDVDDDDYVWMSTPAIIVNISNYAATRPPGDYNAGNKISLTYLEFGLVITCTITGLFGGVFLVRIVRKLCIRRRNSRHSSSLATAAVSKYQTSPPPSPPRQTLTNYTSRHTPVETISMDSFNTVYERV